MSNFIEKLGPGIWYIIHKEALICKDDKVYLQFIYRLRDNFPCEYCKKHFSLFLEKNPVEDYVHIENGLFIWSWKFHNSVNKRLGKPFIPYELALKLYTSESSCNLCMKVDDERPKLEFIFPSNLMKKKKHKIKFSLRDL